MADKFIDWLFDNVSVIVYIVIIVTTLGLMIYEKSQDECNVTLQYATNTAMQMVTDDIEVEKNELVIDRAYKELRIFGEEEYNIDIVYNGVKYKVDVSTKTGEVVSYLLY